MSLDKDIRDFMSRVIPWPADGHGFVNLHWRSLNPHAPTEPDKSFWAGKPTKKVDDFLAFAKWALNRPNIRDIYYCLSLQSSVGQNQAGKPTVLRNRVNALALKAIWLDIDIKEPPKGYATLDDAVDALKAFMTAAGLPPPSALVGSGGGLHVYWISDKPLTPEQWEPYAQGLKAAAIKHGLRCDAGVTADAARILRVPGTLNYKTIPPKAVKLLLLRDVVLDYDFETKLAMLLGFTPGTAAVTTAAGIDLTNFPKRALVGPVDSLADGIEREQHLPLDIAPLYKECAFIRNAIKTGGKDYSQPMWNLSTLAATFLEHGHALAHKMGNKHSGYTKESTDALWDRKTAERKSRGLGWPSCSAIQSAGCTDCAACPHFSKGKSPLNFTTQIPPPAPVPTPSALGLVPAVNDLLMLPRGYGLNPDGYICAVVQEEGIGGAPPTTSYIQLFHNKIFSPWATKDELHFTITRDLGSTSEVTIASGDLLGGTEMWSKLQSQGLLPYTKYKAIALEFLVSWIGKIHNAMKAQTARPMGWYWEGNALRGFVYGETLFKDDGTESPSGFGDKQLRGTFSPVGDLQPWLDACKMITDQKRPDLEVITAASFGAPLMIGANQYSTLLSCWGETGAGKSSAVDVGMAVWANPKRGKEISSATNNSVARKMGEIRNLPLYWDEIKNEEARKQLFNGMFSGSEGIEKGRLRSDLQRQTQGDWQTLMIGCANHSFVEYITKVHKQTAAGVARVFEYEIKKAAPGSTGRIDTIDATRLTHELERNYGQMGLLYAKLLGSNPQKYDHFARDISKAFAAEMLIPRVGKVDPDSERYWVAFCGSVLAGAELANTLGCAFDIPAMRQFLIETFDANRVRIVEEAPEGNTILNVETILAGFMKSITDMQIWTNTFPSKVGKPSPVIVLRAPVMSIPKPTEAQWVVDDRLLRVSNNKFREYMDKHELSTRSTMNGFKQHFNMTTSYVKLGAGTPFRALQEKVLQFPIPPGSPLEDQLFAYRSPGEDEAAAAETGLKGAADQAAADLKLVRDKT